MKSTDTSSYQHFLKVVDCQQACPAQAIEFGDLTLEEYNFDKGHPAIAVFKEEDITTPLCVETKGFGGGPEWGPVFLDLPTLEDAEVAVRTIQLFNYMVDEVRVRRGNTVIHHSTIGEPITWC